MNKNIILLLVAALTLLSATSCIHSDEVDNSIYTDCSITSFSINDIETEKVATDRFGEDSTYTVTLTGSDYTFTIDHLRREIFNNDSLPMGTDITRVVCSVSSDGSVVYKNNDYDPSDENSAEWGATTDSINFTHPVSFRVRAYNLVDYRDYTVRLNVHQCDSFETVWKKVATTYPGQELEKPRAVTFGEKVAVFGVKDNTLQVTVSDQGQNNWSDLTPVEGLTIAAQYTEMTVFQNKLYTIDEKQLFTSTDGITWQPESANTDLSHLLGCNSSQLFAVNDGQFTVSTDAHFWETEASEYQERIPDKNIYSISYPIPTNKSIERTVMVGQISQSTDSIAPVWFRQGKEPWTYMHTSIDKSYFLPNLENLVILYYKEYLIALGGKKLNTKYPGVPLNEILVSLDNGLTWKRQEEDDTYIYPTLCDELKGNNHPFAAYVDDKLNIWILFSETGEVWRGKLNFVDF